MSLWSDGPRAPTRAFLKVSQKEAQPLGKHGVRPGATDRDLQLSGPWLQKICYKALLVPVWEKLSVGLSVNFLRDIHMCFSFTAVTAEMNILVD
ncbi:unnamed protein product [Boreogadus saida]